MTLRADRLVAAAAEELAAVAADLRRVEAAVLPALSGQAHPAVQGFDSILQRIDALALVLRGEAAHLPPAELAGAFERIEGLRLARVADRLLGRAGGPTPPDIELF